MRGTAHLRSPCGLRAKCTALQAAVPGPGEPAGARGTGSERCGEGEIGATAAAAPSPEPKGEGSGLECTPPHSVPLPLSRLDFFPVLPTCNIGFRPQLRTGATWAEARHDRTV